MNTTSNIIHFELPGHLSCPQPTELRNVPRDAVRLLVTAGRQGVAEHTTFAYLDRYLRPGDVLVINTSATQPSALPVALPDGRRGIIHLSTRVNEEQWLLEIREVVKNKTHRWKEGHEGMTFLLPERGSITLTKRFYEDRELLHLWVAEFHTSQPPERYLAEHALPIKYENLNQHYPLEYYQTFFSFHPGSSEMPSAGRGFTQRLVERLLEKGIVFAPILLHTGVSSLEENEAPYPEYLEISPVSAAAINVAKARGKRIVAVGTTAVRAVESAVNTKGKVIPYHGYTDLYIDEDYDMKIVNGLLTGFHEPKASHLHMLQAVAGFEHIDTAYQTAIASNYYWHQFGDLHLIMP